MLPSYTDSITIPETVWYENKEYVVNGIGAYAFDDCYLDFLSIPATVEKIRYNGLTAVTGIIECHATIPPQYLDYNRLFISFDATLRIPKESVDLYKQAGFWERFWWHQEMNIEYIEDIYGIEDVKVDMPRVQSDAVYDLSGRRIANAENLKSGIYIVNGRKVVIK